jgi:two-component system C4-dicarboxylate transport sensor histidine kinase DctB
MHDQPQPRIELAWDGDDTHVRLAVRDHGPGLSEEALQRLFEPFFTTKPAGDGLGLGLAISAGILRDFGGSLHGSNHPDGGAVFTLELPLASRHD